MQASQQQPSRPGQLGSVRMPTLELSMAKASKTCPTVQAIKDQGSRSAPSIGSRPRNSQRGVPLSPLALGGPREWCGGASNKSSWPPAAYLKLPWLFDGVIGGLT